MSEIVGLQSTAVGIGDPVEETTAYGVCSMAAHLFVGKSKQTGSSWKENAG